VVANGSNHVQVEKVGAAGQVTISPYNWQSSFAPAPNNQSVLPDTFNYSDVSLSSPPDLAVSPPDLSTPPDLAVLPPDLSTPPIVDLGAPPDLAPSCVPQKGACVGIGTANCCSFILSWDSTMSGHYECVNSMCCVPKRSSCSADADCCSGYPCSVTNSSTGSRACCQPAGGSCTDATDCCILGAGFNQCNNGKCCIISGQNCNNGGPPNNAACCSGVCTATGQCK
jgi:hypothetical protein